MTTWMDFVWPLLVGIGATAIMDAWSWLLRRLGWPTLDYAMLGRWLCHLRSGQWFQPSIRTATPVHNERTLGWLLHYLTGIALATGWLFMGTAWRTWPSALGFGAMSVLLPWLLLQPALGAGIAASRTPRPWVNRLLSLSTHLAFGAGLMGAWQTLETLGLQP